MICSQFLVLFGEVLVDLFLFLQLGSSGVLVVCVELESESHRPLDLYRLDCFESFRLESFLRFFITSSEMVMPELRSTLHTRCVVRAADFFSSRLSRSARNSRSARRSSPDIFVPPPSSDDPPPRLLPAFRLSFREFLAITFPVTRV